MNPKLFDLDAARARTLGLRAYRLYDGRFILVWGEARVANDLHDLRRLLDDLAASRNPPPEPWMQGSLELNNSGARCAPKRTQP
jgi:hypothetical protein